MNNKYKLGILKNETANDHDEWIATCNSYPDQVEYKVVDLVADNWMEMVLQEKYDFFLTRPPGSVSYFKQLYDERIYIINKVLDLPIYPTLDEILFYENKRFLSYYLKARNIPHPKTWLFYKYDEAIAFSAKCKLPLVAKTNIGASGSGVVILKTRSDVQNYIKQAFSQRGIKRSYLPNLRRGDIFKRLMKNISDVKKTINYFKLKKMTATIDPQKWFVLFQEYIETEYEWRCVVIDESYFGHKKLRTYGEKMSGTSKVRWDYPDINLLNLVQEIVKKNKLWAQAIDLFYCKKLGYLVNEMQCFWGSKNPYQMIKDGRPGKFINKNDNWIFVEGNFNKNNSYDLRLQHILKLLSSK